MSYIEPSQLMLRRTDRSDLEALFRIQLDPEAIHMAAFTSADPSDQRAYMEKYGKHLQDPLINMQTVILDQEIIGSIAKFERNGEAEITYWIDRSFWGKGIATMTLQKFLSSEPARPLFGRVAFDNIGSRKVLEKCGFVEWGTDRGFANARRAEIEEIIYRLE